LNLQNRDGGWPTFCKGWGKLPFDRSCPDITAHALRALDEWYDFMETVTQRRVNAAMQWAMCYLEEVQREDGSWIPLWFGNEDAPNAENPTYGTARVVSALNSISPGRLPHLDHLVESGGLWLGANQGNDGGWGGSGNTAPSVEETAISVEALAGAGMMGPALRGSAWLMRATDKGRSFPTAPIGLYFASLWYSEKLYPVIFTVSALETVARLLR
jgi:squalene-hopene/tetraprenyl-beta-curcumene cyclase